MNASSEKNAAILAKARTLHNVPWCEQYERMVSGMLYDPFVPELTKARFEARRLTTKYNQHYPDDATPESLAKDRQAIIDQLLGSAGKNVYLEPPFYVDYGCNIIVGDDFYCNFNTTILDCGLVTIGDRVLFGPNCSIYAATHETGVESRRQGVEYAREVSIGDDCWIGGGVGIVAGVSIGKGCTIGAGSMVTKDIPDWSVAVGCPAKVIKKVEPVPDLPKS